MTSNFTPTQPAPACFHSPHPWKCEHRSGNSEITVFVEATRQWETVAVIRPTSSTSAQVIAEFITGLVNECWRNGHLLDHAREALEMIMRVGVNFSTEEDAEEVIERIKKLRPADEPSQQARI